MGLAGCDPIPCSVGLRLQTKASWIAGGLSFTVEAHAILCCALLCLVVDHGPGRLRLFCAMHGLPSIVPTRWVATEAASYQAVGSRLWVLTIGRFKRVSARSSGMQRKALPHLCPGTACSAGACSLLIHFSLCS